MSRKGFVCELCGHNTLDWLTKSWGRIPTPVELEKCAPLDAATHYTVCASPEAEARLDAEFAHEMMHEDFDD